MGLFGTHWSTQANGDNAFEGDIAAFKLTINSTVIVDIPLREGTGTTYHNDGEAITIGTTGSPAWGTYTESVLYHFLDDTHIDTAFEERTTAVMSGGNRHGSYAVSYTHLTLPTKRIV